MEVWVIRKKIKGSLVAALVVERLYWVGRMRKLELLWSSLKGGSESCDLSTVQVQQTNTGQKHGYDPIFEVEVKNLCRCELTNVYLWSEGFASSMSVDPKLFRQEGSGFLVNDGKGIPSLMSVKFQYAWDRAYKMTPSAMQEDCAGERNRCEELLLGNKWLPGAVGLVGAAVLFS
ncbi:TPD1 protein homolog 1B isoform X1 [Elaeis guineensis]|uniref:TPD1 protein homolog 1B isoform X1 n=1 Tax=Elaeis guineensis var. tenera TaxID=51953 RepID=UPI003C6D9AE6